VYGTLCILDSLHRAATAIFGATDRTLPLVQWMRNSLDRDLVNLNQPQWCVESGLRRLSVEGEKKGEMQAID
jgi:hypothetical protein